MERTIEERAARLRKIPKREMEWIEKRFPTKGYIYYKKHGALATCFCGACGRKYVGLWKASEDPFEADAQHLIHPAHNKPGKCELCGYETKYKAEGKVKSRYTHHFLKYTIGQRIGEDFVFRIFSVDQIMYRDKKTEYEPTEYIRVYLTKGRKAQKDYHVYDPWTGKTLWIDHNLGGMRSIGLPDENNEDSFLSPWTWQEIKKTPMFMYIPDPRDEEYWDCSCYSKQYPTVRYYEAAAHYPDFEMIAKSGMKYLLHHLIWKWGTGYRASSGTYYSRLGIYKTRVKNLIDQRGAWEVLLTLQAERQTGKHWNDKELEIAKRQLTSSSPKERHLIIQVYKHVLPSKFKRYIEKQTKGEFCPSTVYTEYFDYIRMRIQEGYDLSNEIYLLPKDIHRRHNEMVIETEKRALDKRMKEVNERFPCITERYPTLSERYSAAAAGYIIRPAKDAAEIVTEGRLLHHCVGGDHYLGKHHRGESFILFLRKASEPDVPFITVEIKEHKIIQWYAAYDKQPEKEYFDAWLKTYVEELKKRSKKKKSVRKCTKNVQNIKKTA